MTLPLQFSPEVAEARVAGRAIVALESTIITHGMPWPQNVETARLVATYGLDYAQGYYFARPAVLIPCQEIAARAGESGLCLR